MDEFFDGLFQIDPQILTTFADFFAVFPEALRNGNEVLVLYLLFPGGEEAVLRLTDLGGGRVHASMFGRRSLEAFMLYLDWVVFIFGAKEGRPPH